MKQIQFSEREEYDIVLFIRDKIPMVFDLETKDLKFDARNMYYRVYKYINYLREKIKELEEE